MKVLDFGRDAVHIGENEDISNPNFTRTHWKYYLSRIDYHFLKRRPLFRELISVYSKHSGLKGKVLLRAHGNTNGSRWRFSDEGVRRDVQEWVGGIDGDYAVAYLMVCNSDNQGVVTSSGTIVVHPRDKLNHIDLARMLNTRLFLPGYGYLPDDSRALRRIIDTLR